MGTSTSMLGFPDGASFLATTTAYIGGWTSAFFPVIVVATAFTVVGLVVVFMKRKLRTTIKTALGVGRGGRRRRR